MPPGATHVNRVSSTINVTNIPGASSQSGGQPGDSSQTGGINFFIVQGVLYLYGFLIKGQLISKGLFADFISIKIRTKNFCPEDMIFSWVRASLKEKKIL